VQPTEDPDVLLARRLRALRKHQWSGRVVTQGQLAEVLGGLSVALVSSWEKISHPTPPPLRHLETYALFFATERSVEREPFRLLRLDELTPVERASRDQLLDELSDLRIAARQPATGTAIEPAAKRTLWDFPYDQDVTIACAPLPASMLAGVPFTDPTNPDYLRMARFADLDALIELYGHIRARNPDNQVKCRTSDELRPDDFTSHLVLIGGVDWNLATRDMFLRVEMPVSQLTRPDDDDFGAFTVLEDGEELRFEPHVAKDGDRRTLIEDVAHFYRGPNPYNRNRTVTFLNGMFGRGTFGAVRALTDARFRDRNEAYVRDRFAEADTFSMLSRVPVVNGRVVTPDWTIPENRLHEWSEDRLGDRSGT
jgi:hypothetical protein